MCGGVGTASQSMTDSLSVVCQNLESYFFLMYFVLVMIANSYRFTVLLAPEVEAGEQLCQCSTDALRQVCTNAVPKYNFF